jgi:L-alanine-DL-glutamate epimerase-like enolase superfamily enzyme
LSDIEDAMKVTKITNLPVRDERGGIYHIVKVDTDAGIYGLGEVGILNWSKTIANAVDHLGDLVIGENPWETERLWQDMFRSGYWPADLVYCSAMSAIDIALWDIKGKSVNLPTYQLLGGPVREKVICYPHIRGTSQQEIVEGSKKAVDEGWKFVRWGQPDAMGEFKPNRTSILEPDKSMRVAVDLMGAVREAVGPEIHLCFDVHTQLDPPHVVQMCRDMEEFKPYFIEDPLRSENPGSYRNLRQQVNLPLAAGEQWASKWAFREVIEEELIDFARIDLCIVGGITEAAKITHWAETHYINIVPHNPLGPVSAAACVALCMASSNVGAQEMPVRPGSYATDLFPQQIEWEDGFAWCPDTPGLGVDIDMDAAERGAIDPLQWWPPRLRREDGSITNW